MKKFLVILCLYCFSCFTTIEGVVVKEQIQYKYKPFSIQLFYEYLCIKEIADPEFVIKQAALETGWFKHKYAVKYNNYGGFHYPSIRKTTACGWIWGDPHRIEQKDGTYKIVKFKVAVYKHWTDFVDDLFLYQQNLLLRGISLDNYPEAIRKAGYCPNEKYVSLVMSVKIKGLL